MLIFGVYLDQWLYQINSSVCDQEGWGGLSLNYFKCGLKKMLGMTQDRC